MISPRTFVASAPAALLVALAALLGLAPGCSDDTGIGSDAPFLCEHILASAASEATKDEFSLVPSDLVATAEGTWSGSYPGGGLLEAFDITVTVAPVDEPTEVLSHAMVNQSDYSLTEEDEAFCARVDSTAEIVVDASEADLDLELDSLWLLGVANEGVLTSTTGDDPPRSVVLAGADVEVFSGGSTKTATLAIAFLLDGTLWISLEADGYAFYESGSRE